jgi:hypothetical protein
MTWDEMVAEVKRDAEPLCFGTYGPACERACPYSRLTRCACEGDTDRTIARAEAIARQMLRPWVRGGA